MVILFTLNLVPISHAQSSSDSSGDKLQSILAALKKNFSDISSIQSEVKITRTYFKGYNLEPGKQLPVTLTYRFTFFQSGGSFKYEAYNTTGGVEKCIAQHAHTDSEDQYFNGVQRTLLIVKQSPDKYYLDIDDAALLPYGFLYSDDYRDADYYPHMPSLAELKDANLWNKFLTNPTLKILDDTNPNITTIIFTISGGVVKPEYTSEHTYEVYLSKKMNYFPVGYIKRNKIGLRVQDVLCTKINQCHDAKSTVSYYSPEETDFRGYNSKGELAWWDHSQISNLIINSIAPDDQVFYIDPSIAKWIYDQDKKVMIPVPK